MHLEQFWLMEFPDILISPNLTLHANLANLKFHRIAKLHCISQLKQLLILDMGIINHSE